MQLATLKDQTKFIAQIDIKPFWPTELSKRIDAWNQRPIELRDKVQEVGEAVTALMLDATSGECTRPAGVATEFSKMHHQLLALKISVVTVLAGKQKFEDEIRATYRSESDRLRKLAQDREDIIRSQQSELGTSEQNISNIIAADSERQESAHNANHYASLARDFRALIPRESQALENLRGELSSFIRI